MLLLCFGPSSFRNLEHSTILYEDPKQLPLLRLSWNKQDPNYLATFSMDNTEVREKPDCTREINFPVGFVPIIIYSSLSLVR